MTNRATLLALAERVEAARVSDRTGLRNEVALATGWHRVEPRFTKSKHGAWIKPCDFIGVHSDGSPKLDSLHGTDMHREPPNFLESLDAAMSLVPSEAYWRLGHDGDGADPAEYKADVIVPKLGGVDARGRAIAVTPPLALTAACLRAIARNMTDD